MKTTNESCNDPIKNRIARKRAATELTPGTPAATEHNPPALLGPTCEAPPGSGDMIIESLADVVSKLADECEESAVALCKAARTLRRGERDEVRNLCRPWGVQMGRRIDGKYKRRDLGVLKSELTATFIEKAREHFRSKATVTCEAPPGSGDMIIESLADVVSKLADECEESAVALCKAARTLQRGTIAEVRNLCRPWGVQLTAKNDNGTYSRRRVHVLKRELTATIIEKARELQATEPVRSFPCSDIRRWMPNLKTNQISSLATPAPEETKYADIASFVVKAPLI